MKKNSKFDEQYFEDIIERLSDIIIDELNKVPKELYYYKSHIATNLMHQIVTYAAINHYEGIGMFEEAKAVWREASQAALDDQFEGME